MKAKERNYSDVFKNIGKKIREFRIKAGLSQEGLGFEVGTARNHIGAVERAEKRLSIEMLCRIAKALNVEPRDLL